MRIFRAWASGLEARNLLFAASRALLFGMSSASGLSSSPRLANLRRGGAGMTGVTRGTDIALMKESMDSTDPGAEGGAGSAAADKGCVVEASGAAGVPTRGGPAMEKPKSPVGGAGTAADCGYGVEGSSVGTVSSSGGSAMKQPEFPGRLMLEASALASGPGCSGLSGWINWPRNVRHIEWRHQPRRPCHRSTASGSTPSLSSQGTVTWARSPFRELRPET